MITDSPFRPLWDRRWMCAVCSVQKVGGSIKVYSLKESVRALNRIWRKFTAWKFILTAVSLWISSVMKLLQLFRKHKFHVCLIAKESQRHLKFEIKLKILSKNAWCLIFTQRKVDRNHRFWYRLYFAEKRKLRIKSTSIFWPVQRPRRY